MNRSNLIYPLIFLFILSCTNKSTKEITKNQVPPNVSPTQAAIKENKSIVQARVLQILPNGKNNFKMKIKVLKVFDDGSYPSIAVENQEYVVKPNFAIDSEGKLLNNAKNKGLQSLRNARVGETVKLEIFLQDGNNWLINKKLQEKP